MNLRINDVQFIPMAIMACKIQIELIHCIFSDQFFPLGKGHNNLLLCIGYKVLDDHNFLSK